MKFLKTVGGTIVVLFLLVIIGTLLDTGSGQPADQETQPANRPSVTAEPVDPEVVNEPIDPEPVDEPEPVVDEPELPNDREYTDTLVELTWEQMPASDQEAICTGYRVWPGDMLDSWLEGATGTVNLDGDPIPDRILRRAARAHFDEVCQ